MAYPGEQQHLDYTEYVIDTQSRGETPMSKSEWLKMNKKPSQNALADPT